MYTHTCFVNNRKVTISMDSIDVGELLRAGSPSCPIIAGNLPVLHCLPEFAPLSQWCYPTTWFSVAPFSFCPQSFLASGSFPISQLFESDGKNIGASASASVLPMNIQGWFPAGMTGLISLQSKGLSRVFSSTTVQEHQFFSAQPSLWSNSHIHKWLLEKPQLWLYRSLSAKWYLCFLIHCRGLS